MAQRLPPSNMWTAPGLVSLILGSKLKKKPAFAHTLWKKFEATLSGEQKTNNMVEGYNHAFRLSLPARAANWTVMDRFRTEDANCKTVLHQAAMENSRDDQTGSRAIVKKERANYFKNLAVNYKNMTPKAYMESPVTFFDS
jgi:hypothetical protein